MVLRMNDRGKKKGSDVHLTILFLWISLFLFFSLHSLRASTNPKFSMMMYYVGLMMLDQGVSINEITDQDEYIVMKGVAPDQRTAYLLAEKLFKSRMQREFHFEDIVPFWKKNEFTFILKKPKAKNQQLNIEINSPLTRAALDEKFSLEGSCSKEGSELTVSGDFQGKTICKKGLWTIELSAQNISFPIVGVKVSQGLRGYENHDYRSFLIRKP